MSVLKFRNNETGEWQEIQTIKGDPGQDGKDGYTPVKGVDYFDGEPGKDGKDGVDGKDGADYVLTAADKQEIAGMIEGGGGSGEGASIIFIDISGSYISDESRAALEDYVAYYTANGALKPNTEFYVKNDAGEYVLLTRKVGVVKGGTIWTFCGYVGASKEYSLRIYLTSSGAYQRAYFDPCGTDISSGGGGNWYWYDAYNQANISPSNCSHIKLVYDYVNGGIITLDISASNNNYISEEGGTYYYVVYYDQSIGEVSSHVYFNQYGMIDTYLTNYTFLGYYYWE